MDVKDIKTYNDVYNAVIGGDNIITTTHAMIRLIKDNDL